MANDDTARLLVSIEATTKRFEKQLASIAKQAGDTAGGIEKSFQKANDNIAKGGATVTRSLGQQRAAAQQLSFQLNDVATQLLSGTSGFQVAAQQTGQITQALQQAGGGAAGIKALGSALGSLISPISLVSFGLIALTGYAVEYFTSTEDGTKEANKALKEHNQLVQSVAKQWGDAVPSLKAYAEELERAAQEGDLKAVTGQRIEDIFKDAREQIKGLSVDLADVVIQLQDAGASDEGILKIQDAFNALKKAIDSGKDSTKENQALTEALISEWLNTGVSGAQSFASSIHGIAEAFAVYAKKAKEAADEAQKAIEAKRVLDMQKTLPGNLGQLSPVFSGGGKFMNEADAQSDRASRTKSQFQEEQEKAAKELSKSTKKIKDSFDGLTGTVERYVNQVVKAESGGKAGAKNPNSSATGLGQFIESTWLALFKQNFPDRAKSMSDSTILALRTDADISRTMIEAYAKQNAELLRQAGVSVNEAALHLAHFLGPQGAASVLKAAPGTPVQGLLSQGAINANPTILGGGATVDDVIAYANQRAQSYNDMADAAKNAAQAQKQLNKETQAFQNFGADLVGGFISDLRNGASAADALRNALNRVLDKVIEISLQNMFAGFGGLGGGGGLLGGMLIPGILHKGGVAGSDGYGHGRSVSPSVFAGAKRYHTGGVAGLQPGEVPAILQRGEVVLPRGTKSSAQNVNVTVGVSSDSNGNLLPFVESVSNDTVDRKAPGIVSNSVSRANASAPGAVARYQAQRAGGDYRNS